MDITVLDLAGLLSLLGLLLFALFPPTLKGMRRAFLTVDPLTMDHRRSPLLAVLYGLIITGPTVVFIVEELRATGRMHPWPFLSRYLRIAGYVAAPILLTLLRPLAALPLDLFDCLLVIVLAAPVAVNFAVPQWDLLYNVTFPGSRLLAEFNALYLTLALVVLLVFTVLRPQPDTGLGPEMRLPCAHDALVVFLGGGLALLPLAWGSMHGYVHRIRPSPPGVPVDPAHDLSFHEGLIVAALGYFFLAVPLETFFRGVVQNAIHARLEAARDIERFTSISPVKLSPASLGPAATPVGPARALLGASLGAPALAAGSSSSSTGSGGGRRPQLLLQHQRGPYGAVTSGDSFGDADADDRLGYDDEESGLQSLSALGRGAANGAGVGDTSSGVFGLVSPVGGTYGAAHEGSKGKSDSKKGKGKSHEHRRGRAGDESKSPLLSDADAETDVYTGTSAAEAKYDLLSSDHGAGGYRPPLLPPPSPTPAPASESSAASARVTPGSRSRVRNYYSEMVANDDEDGNDDQGNGADSGRDARVPLAGVSAYTGTYAGKGEGECAPSPDVFKSHMGANAVAMRTLSSSGSGLSAGAASAPGSNAAGHLSFPLVPVPLALPASPAHAHAHGGAAPLVPASSQSRVRTSAVVFAAAAAAQSRSLVDVTAAVMGTGGVSDAALGHLPAYASRAADVLSPKWAPWRSKALDESRRRGGLWSQYRLARWLLPPRASDALALIVGTVLYAVALTVPVVDLLKDPGPAGTPERTLADVPFGAWAFVATSLVWQGFFAAWVWRLTCQVWCSAIVSLIFLFTSLHLVEVVV